MDVKRMIIAVVLSLGIWFLWIRFFNPAAPEKEIPVQQQQTQKPAAVETKPAADAVNEIKVAALQTTKETLIETSTDKYTVTLSSRGGSVTSFKYKEIKKKEKDVELVVNNIELNKKNINAKGVLGFSLYLNKEEFTRGNALENSIWNYTRISGNIIKFTTNISMDGKPVRLEKTYTFNKDSYYFKIDYNIVNVGNKAVVFPNDQIIVSPGDFLGPDMDFNNNYNTINQIYYLNNDFKKAGKGGGDFLSGCGSSTNGDPIKIETGTTNWAGIMSRYFLLVMLPENFNGTGAICDTRTNTGSKAGIYVQANKIQPGEKLARSFKVYAGEKNKDKLAAVDVSLKDAADVSKWIEPIRDFLLWCLKYINMVIPNIGWSLVIFSILSKIVLMPLTIKSTESMKRMQALTPKMNELKEKYKGKPDVLNKEMMKLYKTNKVNPMGGCLPLLLQMPFFFALWSALINSIDLWQAPFIFWIKDLSLPDTVAIIPFIDINFNILPILMTASSFIQQRMMPSAAGGGQQQKMMMLMPLVFIVIFWNMPSGLVLYWTLQNVMQILQQLYSNRYGKTKTVAA
jgi:YidC/Oxa1 family membrane protein insertase